MSTDSEGAIDEFLARTDEVLSGQHGLGQALRVAVDEVPPGTTLWRVVREGTEQFREERIVERTLDTSAGYRSADGYEGSEPSNEGESLQTRSEPRQDRRSLTAASTAAATSAGSSCSQ